MLLLVTDTSGRNGAVSLARASESEHSHGLAVMDSVPLAGGTFSAQLVPQITGLLQKHGFAKNDIDAFVVVSGPGSFTGLRVGLAAIKGLAEILGKAIVPVSLLEVIAVAADKHGRVLALLDAGRGQFYAGEYEFSAGGCQCVREHLIPKQDLASYAAAMTISTPDASLAGVAREAGLNVVELGNLGPQIIANVGCSKLRAGQLVSPEQLDANYVRGSNEIFAKPVSSA